MKPVYKKTIFQKIAEVKREAELQGRELDHIEITEEEQRELCRKRERLFKAHYSGKWKCPGDCYRCAKTKGQRAYDIRLRLEPTHIKIQRNFTAAQRLYDALVEQGFDPLQYMNL